MSVFEDQPVSARLPVCCLSGSGVAYLGIIAAGAIDVGGAEMSCDDGSSRGCSGSPVADI